MALDISQDIKHDRSWEGIDSTGIQVETEEPPSEESLLLQMAERLSQCPTKVPSTTRSEARLFREIGEELYLLKIQEKPEKVPGIRFLQLPTEILWKIFMSEYSPYRSRKLRRQMERMSQVEYEGAWEILNSKAYGDYSRTLLSLRQVCKALDKIILTFIGRNLDFFFTIITTESLNTFGWPFFSRLLQHMSLDGGFRGRNNLSDYIFRTSQYIVNLEQPSELTIESRRQKYVDALIMAIGLGRDESLCSVRLGLWILIMHSVRKNPYLSKWPYNPKYKYRLMPVPSPYKFDKIKATAITAAVIANEPSTIELLARNGSYVLPYVQQNDYDIWQGFGHPVRIAIENGSEGSVIRALMNVPGARDIHEALHWATKKRDVPFLQGLVDCGLDINHIGDMLYAPLHLAVCQSQAAVKFFLSQQGIQVNISSWDGKKPLHYTAVNYKLAKTTWKILLSDHRVDLNARDNQGQTPCFLAARHECCELLEALLDRATVDVNLRDTWEGDSPLHATIYDSSRVQSRAAQSIVRRLLLRRKDIDVNPIGNYGESPLHRAARHGDIYAIEDLLGHPNIDVNLLEMHVRVSALHLAAHNEKIDACTRLASHPDTDVNSRNRLGRTPLLSAIHSGRRKQSAAHHLIMNCRDVDLNARDHAGWTPLTAIMDKSFPLFKILLQDRRVDINAPGPLDKTALHLAAERGYVCKVELLLSHPDINIDLVDSQGQTALDIARQNNSTRITQLLTEAAAARKSHDD